MTSRYYLKNIRTLLTEGFSPDHLRQLCFDTPAFRPVYNQLASTSGKDVIIQRLLVYADQTLQIETLLALAKEHNPARYEEHQPYCNLTDNPTTSDSGSKKLQGTDCQVVLDWAKNHRRENLSGLNLSGCSLGNVDLIGADLIETNLHGAYLREAKLRKANLTKANLSEAQLQKADLSEAEMLQTNLNAANLYVTVLCNAYLRGADLRGATIDGTDLRGADLSYANLCGVNLQAAKMSGDYLNYIGVIWDEKTVWPYDFNPKLLAILRFDRMSIREQNELFNKMTEEYDSRVKEYFDQLNKHSNSTDKDEISP